MNEMNDISKDRWMEERRGREQAGLSALGYSHRHLHRTVYTAAS